LQNQRYFPGLYYNTADHRFTYYIESPQTIVLYTIYGVVIYTQ